MICTSLICHRSRTDDLEDVLDLKIRTSMLCHSSKDFLKIIASVESKINTV